MSHFNWTKGFKNVCLNNLELFKAVILLWVKVSAIKCNWSLDICENAEEWQSGFRLQVIHVYQQRKDLFGSCVVLYFLFCRCELVTFPEKALSLKSWHWIFVYFACLDSNGAESSSSSYTALLPPPSATPPVIHCRLHQLLQLVFGQVVVITAIGSPAEANGFFSFILRNPLISVPWKTTRENKLINADVLSDSGSLMTQLSI